MPENEQEVQVPARKPAKPRPKAKTPANKSQAKEAKKASGTAKGMRSALKPSQRRKSGKPSVLQADDEQSASTPGLFGGLNATLMLQLAAPHTWVASIVPVFLAICMTAADNGTVSALMSIALLLISILMQSAVNAYNDYSDYVAGTDTVDNQDDPTDAVLVYNDVQPYGVRNLAVAFMVVAFLLGIFVIVNSGWIPLVIAVIGAAIAFLYSGGPKPLSYYPVGEIASGLCMGGLITLASYTALTGSFSWAPLIKSIPLIIGIGLIMFTNNTCDIEKDRAANRATLAVSLGRKDSVALYRLLLIAWVLLTALLVVIFYPTGSLVLFFLLTAYPSIMGLVRNPFVHGTREAAMAAIVTANASMALVYGAAILMSGVIVVVM